MLRMRNRMWLALVVLGGCVHVEGAPAKAQEAVVGSSELVITSSVIPASVKPAVAVPVSFSIKNDTAASWGTASTRLVYVGDDGFASADLALGATTKAGKVGTFSGSLAAPSRVGRFDLSWRLVSNGVTLGALRTTLEVTCSDQVFCNGAEFWVNGKCQQGPAPCDDGQACTTDSCNEAAGTCAHTLQPGCASCDLKKCVPHCNNRACGDDGCGGTCGTCPAGQACVDGACGVVTTPGTCASPIPLLAAGEALEGTHLVSGDTSTGINGTRPPCNLPSTARDLVYTFTLTEPMGIDARMTGFDSVLSLRSGGCLDDDPATHTQPNWCSDDASPPGNYGSRIATSLPAGTYFLIADGYNGQQQGPFQLSVRFVRDCVPQCDGKYCGDDGCGGTCGSCAAGQECSATTARCVASPCTPDCRGRQCGNDGCGGTCGSCDKGKLCVEEAGACRSFYVCDHLRPTCKTACSSNEFCGTDCECHRLRDPLPDLVVDRDLLARDVLIDSASFGSRSCAVYEGCVTGTGTRRLLRFSVAAVNQGQAGLTPPAPADHPELFEWGACHGHYHYSGFASYELRDLSGSVVLRGRKQAYCMEDSYQAQPGPTVACDPSSSCEAQGIQKGWADVYGNDLDCQWIDITELASGDYQLAVTLNPNRTFQEASFENNTAIVPVTVP